MSTVSVVVSVHNEEQNIAACLTSVVSFADEIIVVDNQSTDKTAEIARKFTKHVYHQENNPSHIDLQKNFGFEKATKDWILSLDADERITPELAEEIQGVLANDSFAAYQIPRKNIIFQKWIQHSLWWPDYQVRLFQKGKGRFSSASVHKQIDVDGQIGKLSLPLIHENYQTLSQYLQKMDRYTQVEAEALLSKNEQMTWVDAVRRPTRDFLKTFFFQEGYKDGFHGFVLSVLQAFYTFLTVTKVWEKQGFQQTTSDSFLKELYAEWKILQKEVSYWFLSSFLTTTKQPLKKLPGLLRRKYLSRQLSKKRKK